MGAVPDGAIIELSAVMSRCARSKRLLSIPLREGFVGSAGRQVAPSKGALAVGERPYEYDARPFAHRSNACLDGIPNVRS